jgi:CheY-like chemotaxis protein
MKFLVVDDHSIVRDGLAALFEQVSPGFEVFQARNAEEGLRLLDQSDNFDLVILDLFIPGVDGFEAISAFGRKRPELPVIVLSSSRRRPQSLGQRGSWLCAKVSYPTRAAFSDQARDEWRLVRSPTRSLQELRSQLPAQRPDKRPGEAAYAAANRSALAAL